MTDIETRAFRAMSEAFIRLRYYSRLPLNENGRKHLFLVSDAAHNIPEALSGNAFLRAHHLERDLLALEALLAEPYAVRGNYIDRKAERVPLYQRLRTTLGL